MSLANLSAAAAVLSRYADGFEVGYVPNSFPNGAPNHPSKCYISVELRDTFKPVSAEDAERLKRLGWHPEQEGDYWVYPT